MKGKDTNASLTNVFDRIFLTSNDYFSLGFDAAGIEQGGAFNPFNYVYTDGREQIYRSFMESQYTGSKDLSFPENLTAYYRHPWRKNQISDHFPIWFELIIDSSNLFLAQKREEHLQ